MDITFDRFRLAFPIPLVEILNPSVFSRQFSKDGIESCMKFEQKEPFYYQIFVNFNQNLICLEFSGKVLLEEYPNLINASNILSCFENINRYGICYIDPETAITHAMVEQCDVTIDIPYHGTIQECLNSLIIKNNKDYTVTTSTANRFSIENTLVTKRKRERLIVYNKFDEMTRVSNKPFLNFITNREEQLDYFRDKIRLELNLKSVDRIRKYLKTQDTKLYSILNSTVDPIGEFLKIALNPDMTLNMLKHKTPKLRNLEHLLLMCLCDFDLAQVERVVRDTTGKNNSITNTLAPYKLIYEQVERNKLTVHEESYFIELRDLIKKSVSIAFSVSDYVSPNNLYSLYFRSKNESKTEMIVYQNNTFLLNIDMPKLPNLPD